MKLRVPSISIDPSAGFPDHLDIFQRRPFAEKLQSLVLSTDEPLVIALDSPWGEGKTTFIKMWESLLVEAPGASCIYFDAFQNDYQRDAFLAICSHIYAWIESEGYGADDGVNDFLEKAQAVGRILGRATVRIGTRALVGEAVEGSLFESAGAESELSSAIDSYIARALTSTKENQESLDAFRKVLTKLATRSASSQEGSIEEAASEGGPEGGPEGGQRLVIIIDELDRCRPDFALEILERLKHVFDVSGVVFVLVVNREQLEQTVQTRYGLHARSSEYLQKFVSLWISLPKMVTPNQNVREAYLLYGLDKMEFPRATRRGQQVFELMRELILHYSMSLRQIERCLTYFAVLWNPRDGDFNREYLSICVFLSVLKSKHPGVYTTLSDSGSGYTEIVKSADLVRLQNEDWNEGEGHYIKWLLCFFLG